MNMNVLSIPFLYTSAFHFTHKVEVGHLTTNGLHSYMLVF